MDSNTPVDKLSYTQALSELETILRTLQSDSCDVDRLTDLTRRASALLAHCRTRLTATDKELREILDSLEGASQTAE